MQARKNIRMWLAALATVVALGTTAHAEPVHLGIKVKPAGILGLKVTFVEPDSLADILGLLVGEDILTIGNPGEGVPDMLVHSHKDLVDALTQIGDHVRVLVFDGASFFFLEADVEDAEVAALTPDDEKTVFVSEPLARPASKLETVHKIKPAPVKTMLAKVKKAAKKNLRIKPETVTRNRTAAPKWHKAGANKPAKLNKPGKTGKPAGNKPKRAWAEYAVAMIGD